MNHEQYELRRARYLRHAGRTAELCDHLERCSKRASRTGDRELLKWAAETRGAVMASPLRAELARKATP